MLPRSSSSRSPRHAFAPHGAAPGPFSGRRLILAGMVVIFIVYFAMVNLYFSYNPRAPTGHRVNANPRSTTTATQAAAALTGDEKPPGATAADGANAATTTTTPTAVPPKWKRNPNRKYVWLDVAIDGAYVGRVTAELYADLVPKTAENFRALTTGEMGPNYGFKNSVCHRIIQGFIVQCGDFTTGKGYGGKSIYGAKFDDEPNGLRLTHSKRYILQMANSGPNTNGSQFCFMLGPAPHLNGHHVVFGEVVEGFEVVDKMEAAGTKDDGPVQHKVVLLDGGEILP